jgi:hypothetical protein
MAPPSALLMVHDIFATVEVMKLIKALIPLPKMNGKVGMKI